MSKSSNKPANTDWQKASDIAVVQGCLDGDQSAWSELVTRNGRLVYSIPRRYKLDSQTCEDIFQDVFATLLKQLPKIRNQQALPKWLITTTHRMCRAWIKKTSRRKGKYAEAIEADNAPPDQVIRWERQHLVRQALGQLGGRCEQLLATLYQSPADVRYTDVSEKLDMPVGSIGPTRARCLEKLLFILKELDCDEIL